MSTIIDIELEEAGPAREPADAESLEDAAIEAVARFWSPVSPTAEDVPIRICVARDLV